MPRQGVDGFINLRDYFHASLVYMYVRSNPLLEFALSPPVEPDASVESGAAVHTQPDGANVLGGEGVVVAGVETRGDASLSDVQLDAARAYLRQRQCAFDAILGVK